MYQKYSESFLKKYIKFKNKKYNKNNKNNIQDLIKKIPEKSLERIALYPEFWAHFCGKHSTTALFANDVFDIEVLLQNVQTLNLQKNKNYTQNFWQRQTLIHINSIPFMHAHAYVAAPAYGAEFFGLEDFVGSLGRVIHSPNIVRSDFLYFKPSFKNSSENLFKNSSKNSSEIIDVLARHSTFTMTSAEKIQKIQKKELDLKPFEKASEPELEIPALHLFEYFLISEDLLRFLASRTPDVF